MIDAWMREAMNVNAVWTPLVDRTNTGDPVYGAPVPLKCYAAGKTKVISSAEQIELQSKSTFYFLPDADGIKEGDLLALPSGAARQVESVYPNYDLQTGDLYIIEVEVK